MSREAIPMWTFALVLVRLGPRVLVVHERKHGQLWYLPAGRVEPRESLADAARRETLEASGVEITLEGAIRVEHSPQPEGGARLRVVYVARPASDAAPRATPNEHSLGAAWGTLEELDSLPLRGEEVRTTARHVLGGGAVYPLAVLTDEGAPYP